MSHRAPARFCVHGDGVPGSRWFSLLPCVSGLPGHSLRPGRRHPLSRGSHVQPSPHPAEQPLLKAGLAPAGHECPPPTTVAGRRWGGFYHQPAQGIPIHLGLNTCTRCSVRPSPTRGPEGLCECDRLSVSDDWK